MFTLQETKIEILYIDESKTGSIDPSNVHWSGENDHQPVDTMGYKQEANTSKGSVPSLPLTLPLGQLLYQLIGRLSQMFYIMSNPD